MRHPPSYTETYIALVAPVAALLMLPVFAALTAALLMVIWVVARWGHM